MKRASKTTLLSRLLLGDTCPKLKEQLERSHTPGHVICILRPGASHPEPDELVTTQDEQGQPVRKPFKEVEEAIWRKGGIEIIVHPDKRYTA